MEEKESLHKILEVEQEEEEDDGPPPPETPKEPMEFLARSWSIPALELSKAFYNTSSSSSSAAPNNNSVLFSHDDALSSVPLLHNPLSFGSSVSSHLLLDHILPCDSSPQTSGRLSQSSDSINAHSNGSAFASPPLSPRMAEEFHKLTTLQQAISSDPCRGDNLPGKKFSRSYSSAKPPIRGRTVGRWLKDFKEKKKEESRVHNAQLHAAMCVAGVASAVAAVTAATATNSNSNANCNSSCKCNHQSASANGNDDHSKTSMAVASAAALVAAQCVEFAESLGADRNQVASVVNSAVNVRTAGDIMTLTAGAATALRGAAILKARALKELWNNASVIPFEKSTTNQTSSFNEELREDCLETFAATQQFLARGGELLKRTRKGVLHWKMVHVYIKHRQVVVKLKSKHIGNTFTKKKKSIIYEVVKDIAAWPGREMPDESEPRKYFGINTARGLIQFECRNDKEHRLWTEGISKLISMNQSQKRTID